MSYYISYIIIRKKQNIIVSLILFIIISILYLRQFILIKKLLQRYRVTYKCGRIGHTYKRTSENYRIQGEISNINQISGSRLPRYLISYMQSYIYIH